MPDYDKEKIRKIARMLESAHDGEAAAAARKLTGLAQAQGQNLDEMFAAVYGAARGSNGDARAKAEQPRYRPPPPPPNWDDMVREAARARERDDARRAEEHMRQQQQQRSHFEPILQKLQEKVEQFGLGPLTNWEAGFVADILSRGVNYRTSSAQDDVIRQILERYERHAKRNGDEKGFWGSWNSGV